MLHFDIKTLVYFFIIAVWLPTLAPNAKHSVFGKRCIKLSQGLSFLSHSEKLYDPLSQFTLLQ